MTRVAVIGASGHGKKVADALRALGHTMVGYLDTFKAAGTAVGADAVLGSDAEIAELAARHAIEAVVVGIGDNATQIGRAHV